MLSTERVEELKTEIRKIKEDQEETDEFLIKLRCHEEEVYEEIRDSLRALGSSFDASHGDQRWTALVEERYALLLSAERECNEGIEMLTEDRNDMNSRCKSDIEDLEYEIKLHGGVADVVT
ncbi:MAG: hypothetical protein FWD05_02450 [Oscillospiraceae bacterium]|nr:hypothetical protein [Oscillospiraceae bacterium]